MARRERAGKYRRRNPLAAGPHRLATTEEGDRLSWGGHEYLVTKARRHFWESRPQSIEIRQLDAAAPGGLGAPLTLSGAGLPTGPQGKIRGPEAGLVATSSPHTWQMPGLSPAAGLERERVRAQKEADAARRLREREASQVAREARRTAREQRAEDTRLAREQRLTERTTAEQQRKAEWSRVAGERADLLKTKLAQDKELQEARLRAQTSAQAQALAFRQEQEERRREERERDRLAREAREAQRAQERAERQELGFLGRSSASFSGRGISAPGLSAWVPSVPPASQALPAVSAPRPLYSPSRLDAMRGLRQSGYQGHEIVAAFQQLPDEGTAEEQAAAAFRFLGERAERGGLVRNPTPALQNPATYRGGITNRFAAAARAAAQARGLTGPTLEGITAGADPQIVYSSLQDAAGATEGQGDTSSLADEVWNAAAASTKRRTPTAFGEPTSWNTLSNPHPTQHTHQQRNPAMAVFAILAASLVVWGWAQGASAGSQEGAT